jgi:uncharacterized membrane protein YraQ (UPF0718 family)
VGLRKQQTPIGAALAFFLGNPLLNPATLVFIGFVLSWQFVLLRIVFGILLVFVVAWYADKITHGALATEATAELSLAPIEDPHRTVGGLATVWAKELWVEIYQLLPGYALIVLVLGAARAWLFPSGLVIGAHGFPIVVALSVIGTLFVIPTAGEVPIIQTLMGYGMGSGAAAALLITLPAISLPSIWIVRRAFPARVLGFVALCVALAGVLAGVAATLLRVH